MSNGPGRLLRTADGEYPRSANADGLCPCTHADGYVTDPLRERAAVVFAADLAADRVSLDTRNLRCATCRPAARTAAAGVSCQHRLARGEKCAA